MFPGREGVGDLQHGKSEVPHAPGRTPHPWEVSLEAAALTEEMEGRTLLPTEKVSHTWFYL